MFVVSQYSMNTLGKLCLILYDEKEGDHVIKFIERIPKHREGGRYHFHTYLRLSTCQTQSKVIAVFVSSLYRLNAFNHGKDVLGLLFVCLPFNTYIQILFLVEKETEKKIWKQHPFPLTCTAATDVNTGFAKSNMAAEISFFSVTFPLYL